MDVKKLLSQMSTKEKVFQLLQLNSAFLKSVGAYDATGPMETFKLKKEDLKLLGTVLNSLGAGRMKEIQTEFLQKNPHGIPLMFMQDVIHGHRTIYPINLGLAASWDMQLVYDCAAMAAKEAAVDGVQVNFAPMVDLARDARWGRVMETSGEDPFLNSKIAATTVKAYQGDDLGSGKFAACVKHFAGYGAAEAGRDYNTVDMSERTFREYYLPAYKAAVDAGVKMVMTSFNVVDGIPATGNKWLMKDILRDEWGFKGVLITDYNAMGEMMTHAVAEDYKEVAELAMNAGVDIEMMSAAYPNELENLIEEGKISMQQLDDAVLRVLQLKNELGLFENPYKEGDEEKSAKMMLCPEHRAIVRRAAEDSAVLLKNNGVLPFSKNVKSVAVIGPHADSGEIIGFWQCGGRAEETTTVAAGIKAIVGQDKVFTAKGCDVALDSMDESKIAEAVALAQKCEAVVLCVGEHERDSGEGNSKQKLDLPAVQQKLVEEVLKVNQNAAVLLFTGRPLTISRLDEVAPAILNMWFPGTEGGSAAANLLFGNVVPSGKITMTFPKTVGQCPIYYNHYMTGRPRVRDDIRTGYCSSYIDGPNAPLYPFGYGLSYSTFEYSPATLSADKMTTGETITVSAKVKNTGKYAAKEIVQLYIRDLVGSTVRPVKELKGFEKIELQPGEEKEVSFVINEELLAFYGKDLKRKAEKGKFHAFIGANSDCNNPVVFELI